jgi:hypothetical protein
LLKSITHIILGKKRKSFGDATTTTSNSPNNLQLVSRKMDFRKRSSTACRPIDKASFGQVSQIPTNILTANPVASTFIDTCPVVCVCLEYLDGILVVQLGGLGVSRQIVDAEVEQGHEGVLFCILLLTTRRDVFLQFLLPVIVTDFGDLVAIVFEYRKIFVHAKSRMTSDMYNIDTVKRIESSSYNNPCNVIDWH